MLYFFYGNDHSKTRDKAKVLLDSLKEKKKEAAFFKFDQESWNSAEFDGYLSATGLFEQKVVLFLDNVFEREDAQKMILENLDAIADSPNIIILLQTDLDAKTKNKIIKVATKSQDCTHAVREESPKNPNIFALTDAFGKRDKKSLWVLYRKALGRGAVAEEIHGLLWWQIKTMLQVSAGSVDGIKPFVLGKAKQFLKNYSSEELYQLAGDFVLLYHRSRRGLFELDIALERWILSL